jgi:acetylornithine/N-succinyldiaminopimelate aminotransferase
MGRTGPSLFTERNVMASLSFKSATELDETRLMGLYRRFPALIVKGSGCRLWDAEGREYLDFLGGIAVCQLGHCHPALVAAIQRQAAQLIHASNFLLTEPAARLAAKLCDISGMDKAFFTVCGASAIETAIKIAKKRGLRRRPKGDYGIVSLQNGFHGRTLGALSATGQTKYQNQFAPLVPGFDFVEANDLGALRAAVDERTAAVILEPIQGEGGVFPLTTEYLREARRVCDESGALLILDEVQTGMGRTGAWFHYQQHGIVPDVVAVAKGLGSGMPIGACLARGEAASVLEPGDHGTTYGGNPISCAAGLAVIETIERERLLENAAIMGTKLREGLLAHAPLVRAVRGEGLMLAAQLREPNATEVVARCFELGLVANTPCPDAVRFVPPLVVTEGEIDHALAIFQEALGQKAPKARKTAAVRSGLHGRDVLGIDDLSREECLEVLTLAGYLKERRGMAPSQVGSVENRTVALLFEKPSLRTRVSFEAAVAELGGHPVYLGKSEVGMGSREAIKDVASNLGRWCAAVVARLYWHRHIVELADYCSVPVINALTEIEHPCQALADFMTAREAFGEEPVKIAYVGDANNVANSLAKLSLLLGYPFALCGPKNFWLDPELGAQQTESLDEALADAKVVYTDVWISMGDEHEQEHRLKVFEPYQVDAAVMAKAHPEAIFMHCLPARRGFEVTDDVIDGPQSRVVDQAENRLYAQKALLRCVLGW